MFTDQVFQPEKGLYYWSISLVQIQVQTCDEYCEWDIAITVLFICKQCKESLDKFYVLALYVYLKGKQLTIINWLPNDLFIKQEM